MSQDHVIVLDKIDEFTRPCVLAIGIFDGLHRGHQRVLTTAKALAKKLSAEPCVLTFDPHPSRIVSTGPESVEMICSSEERALRFIDFGIRRVFFKKFDKKFASLDVVGFEKFLKRKFPNLRGIITGQNFLYGKKAAGNPNTLAEMSERNGWVYFAVEGLHSGGERISSTRLRRLIKKGDMGDYKRLAGSPYTCVGIVKSGKKLGRTIGFPTLNIEWNPDCKPAFGVYAVKVYRNNKVYEGVANYGCNPTTDGLALPLLEVNLFETPDFSTRAKIKVELMKFIRPERKFKNLDELKCAIKKSKDKALKYFRK